MAEYVQRPISSPLRGGGIQIPPNTSELIREEVGKATNQTIKETKDELKKVNNQLIEKATKEEVKKVSSDVSQKANIKDVRLLNQKIEPEELSERSLGLITGEAEINLLSIPQNKSVSPHKTDFINSSVNYFNKLKTKDGGYYHADNFTWRDSPSVCQSEYIPVTEGDIVRINPSRLSPAVYMVTFKNSSGVIFTGVQLTKTNTETEVKTTVPKNAVSVGTALYIDEKNQFMLTINQPIPNEYVPHEHILSEDIKITKKNMKDTKLFLDDYLLKIGSDNSFDKTKVRTGGFYRATTLVWEDAVNVAQSEFVPVKSGDKVTIKSVRGGIHHFVFKKADGTLFNGGQLDLLPNNSFSTIAPVGAESFSSALYIADMNDFKIIINDGVQPALTGDLQKAVQNEIPTSVEKIPNYSGKYLSILGDSISTFSGYIPQGHAVFYTGANMGVTNVKQTWWHRLLDQTGMRLCVNNSWSGSRVTTTGGNDSAGCLERATKLHTSEKNPDVIIVYLGINDFNGEVGLGTYDGTTIFPTITTTFKEAYSIMLSKILLQYKHAEIYVCTLPYCERNGDTNFPEKNDSNVLLVTYNKAIMELADLFSVNVLPFHKSGLTFYNKELYMNDTLHPNANGHKLLGNKAIKTIDPASSYSVL